jgi:RNA polymerase sigma-70 factor (ECF subfamily)
LARGEPATEQVQRAQAGDGEALEGLCRRWLGAVYGRALRVLGDPELAGDVVSETMLEALGSLSSLRDAAAFPAWLRRITERCIARVAPAAGDAAAEPDLAPSPADGPEAVVLGRAEAARVRRWVRAALQALPPRSRLAMELFYYRELSCRQVAEFLGTTPGAVKVLLHEARQELRTMAKDAREPAVAEAPPRIASSCLSGSETRRNPLGAHDSPVARLFCALYPTATLEQARARAGLSAGEAEALLEPLLAARFVERTDGGLRCRVPLLLPTDWLLLKPWLQRAADAAEPLLAEIRASAAEVSRLGRDEDEVAMLEQVLTVPVGTHYLFLHLGHGMGQESPDRGPYGRFLSAYVAEGVTEYRWGWRGGFSDSDDGRRWSVIAAPSGMDYTDRDRLQSHLPGHAPWGLHMVPGEVLWDLVEVPLTAARLAELAERHGYPSGDELGRALLAARLAVRAGNDWRHHLPVLPYAGWQRHRQVCEVQGQRFLDTLPDVLDDLRARIAQASFRDADYLDAAFLGVMLVKDEVDRRAVETGPAFDPAELPPNWGIVLAC